MAGRAEWPFSQFTISRPALGGSRVSGCRFLFAYRHWRIRLMGGAADVRLYSDARAADSGPAAYRRPVHHCTYITSCPRPQRSRARGPAHQRSRARGPISLAATTEIASCNQRDHSSGGFRRSAEGERIIRQLAVLLRPNQELQWFFPNWKLLTSNRPRGSYLLDREGATFDEPRGCAKRG